MNSLNSGNNFSAAYDQGYEAYQHGLSKNTCLFLPGTHQHIAWNKGYDDAEEHENDIVGDSHLGEYIVVGFLLLVVLCILVLLFITH